MEGIYPVIHGDKTVGEAQICKKGLYYFVSCKCRVPNDSVYKLYIGDEAHRKQLGILVPCQDHYSLQMHLPISKLCPVDPAFNVYSTAMNQDEESVILQPDQEVSCLSKLDEAYLQMNGDVYTLKFKENHH